MGRWTDDYILVIFRIPARPLPLIFQRTQTRGHQIVRNELLDGGPHSENFSSLRRVLISQMLLHSGQQAQVFSPLHLKIDWLWEQNDCRTSPWFGRVPRRWPLTACIPTSCISLTSPTLFLSSDVVENAQMLCRGDQTAYFFFFFGTLFLLLWQLQQ